MIRVLVVEDDASTGALLVQLVKRLWPQATVTLVSDAYAALEHWTADGADLVLLDWGLPGMTGVDVLKQIRRSGKEAVCVMISGHADREVILAARANKIDAFIVKPFNAKQVMARLSEIMSLPQAEKPPAERYGTLEKFIDSQMNQGRLGLPIDPALVASIEGIRALDPANRVRLLRQCQAHPALVMRALSLVNGNQYLQGKESVESFEEAVHQIGLSGFINLAVEMSLIPGSHLQQDFLKTWESKFLRDAQLLADVIARLGADVQFDLKASRTACMLYRVGELSLLQLMQAWFDMGHEVNESACAAALKKQSSQAGNLIKTQWGIPNTIRARIGAAYLLPSGTVRIDAIAMRIASLLISDPRHQDLPRLLARAGIAPEQAERYVSPEAAS